MADPKKLAKFTPKPAGNDFMLHIEDESGRTLELFATRDQIDVIADTLDELLSQDGSADEVATHGDEADGEAEGKQDEQPAERKPGRA